MLHFPDISYGGRTNLKGTATHLSYCLQPSMGQDNPKHCSTLKDQYQYQFRRLRHYLKPAVTTAGTENYEKYFTTTSTKQNQT